MPEVTYSLTLRQVKRVAELVAARERIDNEIRDLVGSNPPMKGMKKKFVNKPKEAAPPREPRAAKDPDAPKNPGRQLHAMYMVKVRSLDEQYKTEAKRIKKEQGTEKALEYIASVSGVPAPTVTETEDAFAAAGTDV